MSQTFETQIGGRTLTIETGKLATLAGGSVTVRYGDTMVLGTANRSEPRPGLDFFPLTVDFEERMYAAGKIPGGFIKREARPSENAILAARQTDRPIRPLFPKGYKDDVQLVITVLSTDQENLPDVVGTIAASAALTISEIPFNGPIASVRVGRIDGEFVVNPTFSQMKDSELDLIVAGTRDAIMMVEAGANLLPEAVMAEAILFGHRALQPIVDLQEQLQKAVGKAKRIPYIEPPTDSVLDFASATDAKRELVVIDVETTGTDPKMSDLVEVAAVKIKGTKVVDRWSTFVNPGRPIVGNQMHGITDKDVQGAPSPKEAADKLLAFVGDALDRRPQRRLRPRLHRRGQGRGLPVPAGHLPRHAGHRPRGLSRAPSRTSSVTWRASSASSSRRATAPCRTPRRPRSCCSGSPTTCRVGSRRCVSRSPMRSAPSAAVAIRPRCSRPPGARRASARTCSAWSRRRPSARSSSTRASGSTAAA